MTTVAQLVKLGYKVAPSTTAVGCTSLTSNVPFWYYNPRFHKTMDQLQAGIQAATQNEDGTYGILVAGSYAGDIEFPFEVILLSTKTALDLIAHNYAEQQRRVEAAQAAMDKAREQYQELLQKVTA